MTAAARMAAIDKSLEGYSGMLARVGDTMSAKMGEAEAHIVKIVRLGGMPIFDAALQQLSKMNDYFTKNEQSVVATGKAIATTLVNALKVVIDNFGTIVNTVKNLLELWVSFKVGVVSAEITSGLMLIASAFKAITSAAEGAAAAEAVATEGISALVGLAAGAATYAGMKVMEGKTKRALAAPIAARVAPLSYDANKQLGNIYSQLGDVSFSMYKADRSLSGFMGLLPDMQEEVLRKIGAAYPVGTSGFREAFGSIVEELGFDISNLIPSAKFAKQSLPGGPKKADVIIENARFDIKQAFAEGYDPDRIAAAFVEQIGSTALYPGQSGFAGAATGAA
jgi:hypothetical protein